MWITNETVTMFVNECDFVIIFVNQLIEFILRVRAMYDF